MNNDKCDENKSGVSYEILMDKYDSAYMPDGRRVLIEKPLPLNMEVGKSVKIMDKEGNVRDWMISKVYNAIQDFRHPSYDPTTLNMTVELTHMYFPFNMLD